MRALHGVAGGVLLTTVLLSCFSERPEALAPVSQAECGVPGSAIGSGHAIVLIRGFRFLPDTLRVSPGTTVTWVNCEPASVEAHTSTAVAGAWDSGPLPPGDAFERTFTGSDSFSYFCRPHPGMRGVVIVE